MASTTEDGAFQAHFKKNELTLYLTKKGRRVLGVTFHDTSSWCYGITWICTLIPDEYSPYINLKFLQQLSTLKEKFATLGRLTSMQIDRRMFVFRHETEDKAIEMLGSYTTIEEIILKFLHETGAQVTDIKMKSEVDEAAARKDQETSPRGTTDQDVLFSSKHKDDVDAPHSHLQQRHGDVPQAQEDEDAAHPHAQKDEDAAHLSTGSVTKTGMTGNSRADKSISAGKIRTKEIHQDNRTVNNKIIINLPSGKAVVESCWKAKHENIPQPTGIDNESVKILLKERLPDSLVAVWWECMVFCFEHESMEHAMGMIVQHARIKKDILHFLQKLDPSIEDIVMEVEVRELSESEEQTAETSETRPRGMADPEHKDEEGASRSHPLQRDDDETSHPHTQEKGDNSSLLSQSPQKEVEDTCLPHPQKTEEDKMFHPHPQQTYVKGTVKYQPIGIQKETRPRGMAYPEHKDEEGTSRSHPHQKDETSHLHIKETGDDICSLSHSPQKKKKYEDTCLPHPQKTEEDKTSLQQTDEDTSHLQPQEVYVKDKFKYQPIKIEKETRPRGMADPDHKDEEGTSRSHPQQKDETSHLHIKETGDNISSLSHSPQKKKKYEDTCLPHPQKTEEDKTSLQQTDEDTSHLQPQEVYVKDKFKYQPIKIEKASSDSSLMPLVKGQDSDRRASSEPSQGQSRRKRYPRLSTALHATPSQADRDLHYASKDGDLEKVKRLLSTPGVDINFRVDSLTPVMIAAYKGRSEVVKHLVRKGADVSLVDDNGNNTLHIACGRDNVETVEFVLSLNVVDINSRGMESQTPVMRAARDGHRDVVELLMGKGADASLVDKAGNNTLHFACRGGDVETVEFVLSQNVVDINARNKSGWTAADAARVYGHQPVADLVKSRGGQ